VADGDRRERFERLFVELSPRVLGYALRRAEPEEARDVLADTFAVAWTKLDRVPPGEEALPWLLAVARKVMANRRRATDRRSRTKVLLEGARTAIPDHAETVAGLAELATAFAALSPEDRETLALVSWDGLTSAEASIVAGCSVGAFSVRLHRARKRLAALLEDPLEVMPRGSTGGA
jgi:RNA polymerase sigma factor (sigma-70 family)